MTSPDDRYVELTVKTLPDGRQVYAPARPIKVTADPLTDPNVTANEGDRLDVMAQNVYGSSLDWYRIASANSVGHGSLHLRPGTRLVIPRK